MAASISQESFQNNIVAVITGQYSDDNMYDDTGTHTGMKVLKVKRYRALPAPVAKHRCGSAHGWWGHPRALAAIS